MSVQRIHVRTGQLVPISKEVIAVIARLDTQAITVKGVNNINDLLNYAGSSLYFERICHQADCDFNFILRP